MPADQGAPFSAVVEIRIELAIPGNTTQLTDPGSGTKWWRDAQGRTRVQEPDSSLVQLCDPTEGACYVLDSEEMIAHRMEYRPREVLRVDQNDAGDEQRRLKELGVVSQALEERMIQGVKAKRYASQLALLHEAHEIWFAPALGLAIRSVARQGMAGQGGVAQITELLDLRLGDPSPDLFVVPAGYKIQNEAGSFTVSGGSSR